MNERCFPTECRLPYHLQIRAPVDSSLPFNRGMPNKRQSPHAKGSATFPSLSSVPDAAPCCKTFHGITATCKIRGKPRNSKQCLSFHLITLSKLICFPAVSNHLTQITEVGNKGKTYHGWKFLNPTKTVYHALNRVLT